MLSYVEFVLYLCTIVQLAFAVLIIINRTRSRKSEKLLIKPLLITILALSLYPLAYLLYFFHLGWISFAAERAITMSGSILCYSIVVFTHRISGSDYKLNEKALSLIASAIVILSIYPGLDTDIQSAIIVFGTSVSNILTIIYYFFMVLCMIIVIGDYRHSSERSPVYMATTRALFLFAVSAFVFDCIPYYFWGYIKLTFLGPLSGLIFSGTLYWACAKKNFFRLRESLNLLSLIILTMLVSTGFVIPLGQQPLIKAIIITICVGLVIDVWRKDTRLKTDYRRAKKKIKLLTAEQQGASSYIMDIAHRLKSPLAAVQHLMIGMRTKLAAEQSKLDRARSIVADTARAMKNLLLSGKIDHRDASISRAPFDLAAALREWREEWQALCAGNPVELTLAASKIGVDADRNALKDALTNLVDNARKHSPTGAPISVELKLYDGSAEIAVTDRGPGLPTNVQSLIFQRHYQHKTGPNRESSSSAGLGLHLAKWVAEQHGGEIRVHSRPNRGATFTISLPRPRQEVAEQIDRKPPRWSSRRVQIKTLRPQ